ncbi:Uncharacterised protein [Escherichia coli]|nr:Uncharacterised protein [Escherichia coli]
MVPQVSNFLSFTGAFDSGGPRINSKPRMDTPALIQKIALQPRAGSIKPASMTQKPEPPHEPTDHQVNAVACFLPSNQVFIRAMVDGMIQAAEIPCSPRPIINIAVSGANATIAEPATLNTTPINEKRILPKRSASAPAATIQAAEKRGVIDAAKFNKSIFAGLFVMLKSLAITGSNAACIDCANIQKVNTSKTMPKMRRPLP